MQLIRVTQLEQFRKWMTGCFYVNEQSVIDSLSGNFQGNNKTRIGTAGHKVVELGRDSILKDCSVLDNIQLATSVITVDDEYFSRYSQKQTDMLLAHRYFVDGAFHEQKYGKEFQTKHYPIYVGGTIDIIHGITLRDNKFVFRTPDYSNYTESQQWKLYLEFMELDIFYFDLFEFKGYKDEMKLNVSSLEMVQHEPLECIRYKNMEQDNQLLVEQFIDWIEFRQLKHLLMDKKDYFNE